MNTKSIAAIARLSVRLIAAGALFAHAGVALAQYVWVNDKGVKQYSDQPPPPGTPQKNILKAPGGSAASAKPATDADADSAAPSASASERKAAPTLAEREADYRKRKAEREKNEKQASEDAANKAAKAENCDIARRQKTALDSGVRMGAMDKNGQRYNMDNAQRAQEQARTDRVLEGCK